MIVKHKFFDHKINPNTRTLVIGTFNPATEENDANFFCSRQRNFLWTLIPNAFGKASLKGASKDEKIKFVNEFNIDFVDLILEVNVEKADNYDDGYIDKKVEKWNENINSEIDKLKHLEKVCFTRKT